MASTVREFAVKLTADTKEFQTSVSTATKTVETLVNTVKSLFGSVERDIKKASAEVNKAIERTLGQIGADSKNQMDQVVKNITDRLGTVEKGSKQETELLKSAQRDILKIRQQGAKEAEKIEKQRTDASIKQVERKIKDIQKEAGQFKLDIVEIETERPIKDVQDLGRALATSNRETQEKIRRELKALDSQNIDTIREGRKNLLKIIEQANDRQEQAIKDASRERLKLAGDNAEKRIEIEKQLQKDLASAREAGQARVAAVERTAGAREETAPSEERIGRIGRGGAIISELGDAAQDATARLGPLGVVLQKLGPVGLAIGGTIGLLGAGFVKAAEASGNFTNGLAKIKTTIDPGQFESLNAEMSRLREFSVQTGVSMESLSDGMFQAASAVAAYKSDVGATVDAVKIASTSAVGLGADSGDLVSVMGDLANSFNINAADSSNLQFIMDNMAVTFRDGKIQGDELADSIVRGAKTMSLLSADARGGISTLSAFTASLTASGLDSKRTAASIDALNNEFLDLPTATKLAEKGLQGISTEGGKVQVDFKKLFASAGDDFEQYAQLLGSDRAKLAFRTLAGTGESAFLNISKGFKNVSGASQAAFDIMQDTSQAASDRLDASLANLAITMGSTADTVMTDLTNFAATALGTISDLFKSTEQEALESQGRFEQFTDISDAIGTAVSTVASELESLKAKSITSGDEVDAAIAKIGATALQFKDQFPLIADDINNIINSEGDKTIQTLEILNQKMAQAQELAQAEAFLTNFETTNLQAEAFIENLNELNGLAGNVKDTLEGFTLGDLDILGQTIESFSETDITGNLNEQLDAVSGRLSQFRAEQGTVDTKTIEGAERLREINEEVKGLITARQQLSAGLLQTETSLDTMINQQVMNAQRLAQVRGEEFNLSQAMQEIQFNIQSTTGATGDFQQLINDKLTERTVLLAQEAGDIETLKALETERLGNEINFLEMRMAVLSINGQLTEGMEAQLNAQLEQLDIELASVDANGTLTDQEGDQVDLLGEQVDLQNEIVDLSQEQEAIKEAVNDITSEILDNETLSTDNKILQLEKEANILLEKEAQLQIEMQELETQFQKAQAQVINNDLSAEAQDTARATAEAIREQVMLLAEEAAIASSAAAQIGAAVSDTKTRAKVSGVVGGRGRRSSGGGGGSGRAARDTTDRDAERAARDTQKAAEKAEKDRQKREEDAFKQAQKLAQDRAKAEQKLERERQKRAEEAEKQRLDNLRAEADASIAATIARQKEAQKIEQHAQALALAEQKIRDDLAKFSDQLREQSIAFIGQSVNAIEQLIAPFQSEAEKTFKSLQQIAEAAERSVEDIQIEIKQLEQKEIDIQANIDLKLGEVEELETDPTLQLLSGLQAEFEENKTSIESLNNAINDIGPSLKTAQNNFDDLKGDVEAANQGYSDAAGALENAERSIAGASGTARSALNAFRQEVFLFDSTNKDIGAAADVLDKALESLGVSVSGGRLEFKGMTETFVEWEDQFASANRILEAFEENLKNSNSGIQSAKDNMEKYSQQANNLAQPLSRARNELIGLQNDLQFDFGTSNIDVLKNKVNALEEDNIDLTKSIKPLEQQTGEYGQQVIDLNKKISDLGLEFTKTTGRIDELKATLEPADPDAGISQADAKAQVKRFEAVALGFSDVSKELDKVIALQGQALEAVDPREAANKFMEAENLLKRITEDFELFGISIDGLVTQASELQNLNIEDILTAAFGTPEDLAKLTKEERERIEVEKERTKILLESAITLLQLQTEIKDQVIATNASTEDSVVNAREQAKIQESFQAAKDAAGAFSAKTLEDERTNAEKLTDEYKAVNNALWDQRSAAQAIRMEEEKIRDINQERLTETQNQIAVQQQIIAGKVAERNAATDPAEIQRLNEEIASQKQILDTLGEAQTVYNDNVIDAQTEIDRQNDNLAETEVLQIAANDALKEQKPIGEAADQAKAIEKENEAREKQIEIITEVANRIGEVIDLGEAVGEGIAEMEGLFRGGDAAGAMVKGAELTQQIGQALLGSGIPFLMTAGAILLGVGFITEGIAKIFQAIVGREQTSEELAQSRLDTIEQQNSVIENQLALMDDLVSLGDASVDTARERLDMLRAQRDALIEQDDVMSGLLEKSPEQLLQDKLDVENNIELTDLWRKRLESAKELSEDAQREIVKGAREALGFNFEFGNRVNEADINRFVASLDGVILDLEGDLSQISFAYDMNLQMLEEEFGLLDERIESAEFKIEIATVLGDTDLLLEQQDQLLGSFKDKFTAALARAEVLDQVGDISRMSVEQLKDIDFESLFAGLEVPDDVMDSWLGIIDTIDTTIDNQMSFLDTQMEGNELQKDLIDAKEAAGRITSEKADKETLAVLKEQRKFLKEQQEILGKSVELTIKRLNLQAEINKLKADGNEIDDEANRLLMESIRLRQSQIEQFRQMQDGAPLTSEQQVALSATDEQIRSQLTASGMTETQVEEFMRSLPAFEQGGTVPETGLAVVHKGELVIPANQVKEMEEQIRQFSQIVGGSNAIANGTDSLTKDFSRIILEQEAQNVNQSMVVNTTLGDIVINLPAGIKDPVQIATVVKKELTNTITGTVQRAIDQNKLDLRGKKI